MQTYMEAFLCNKLMLPWPTSRYNLEILSNRNQVYTSFCTMIQETLFLKFPAALNSNLRKNINDVTYQCLSTSMTPLTTLVPTSAARSSHLHNYLQFCRIHVQQVAAHEICQSLHSLPPVKVGHQPKDTHFDLPRAHPCPFPTPQVPLSPPRDHGHMQAQASE